MSRILVVGASSGIGAALVTALREDGHLVQGASRTRAEPDDLLVDVQDEDHVRRLFAALPTVAISGLEAVIVTAGIFGDIGRVEFSNSDAWERALRTNVLGLYYVAKHAIPLLEEGTRSRLIAFSGGGAFGPFPRFSAYACSKAAVVRLIETLADELRPKGITVNAVAPGMVSTPIHEQTIKAGAYRAGTVQFQKTLALQDGGGVPMAVPVNCVRWLLSPEADGITGRTIAANFDPWGTPAFVERCATDPDYCTLRRAG